jgi:hypothetical protein
MLIDFVHFDIDNGEHVTEQSTRGTAEDTWIPDPDNLVNSTGSYDVGCATVAERVDPFVD